MSFTHFYFYMYIVYLKYKYYNTFAISIYFARTDDTFLNFNDF